MRDFFERLDDALIDKAFQPSVDWIAENLLFDCFQQARFCTSISAVAWILSQAGAMAAAARSGSPGRQAFQAALLLLGLGAIVILQTLFQRVGGAGKGQGGANPLRVAMYTHRLTILLGLAVSIVKVALGVGSLPLLAVALFAAAAVYAGACSNPPPKQHQYRQGEWGLQLATVRRLTK